MRGKCGGGARLAKGGGVAAGDAAVAPDGVKVIDASGRTRVQPFPKAPDGAGARRSGWLPTAMTAAAAGVSGGPGAAAGATSEREGTADTDEERVALGLSYNGS